MAGRSRRPESALSIGLILCGIRDLIRSRQRRAVEQVAAAMREAVERIAQHAVLLRSYLHVVPQHDPVRPSHRLYHDSSWRCCVPVRTSLIECYHPCGEDECWPHKSWFESCPGERVIGCSCTETADLERRAEALAPGPIHCTRYRLRRLRCDIRSQQASQTSRHCTRPSLLHKWCTSVRRSFRPRL